MWACLPNASYKFSNLRRRVASCGTSVHSGSYLKWACSHFMSKQDCLSGDSGADTSGRGTLRPP